MSAPSTRVSGPRRSGRAYEATLSWPLWEKWTADDGVGNHHLKLLRAFQTFNRLVRLRPKSVAGQYLDDLLLLAVTAGNSHNGIRLFQLCLGHNRPPGEVMLVVGSLSVNRMAVNFAVENPVTEDRTSRAGTKRGSEASVEVTSYFRFEQSRAVFTASLSGTE